MSITSHPSRRCRLGITVTATATALTVGVAGAVAFTSAPAGASTYRAPTTYTVSKSGMVTGKKSQAPGRIEVNVAGSKGQEFQLVRSRHGAGASSLMSDAATLNNSGNPNPLEKDFVLIGGAPVGQTFYALLHPGEYYAVDPNQEKLSLKGVKHIHVADSGAADANPGAITRIQAIGEESWYAKPKTMPASGTIEFQNKAAQSHFIVLARMKPGKNRSDIAKVFQGKEKQGAVFYSGKADEFDTGVMSPHNTSYVTYSLKPGTWALLCFWPDRKTHMPHAYMGMYRTIKLT